MFNDRKVVDFEDFHFEGVGYNHPIAKKLSLLLIDEIDVDDLRGFNDTDSMIPSSVGSGRSENGFLCPTESSARAILASHLASYANRKYRSCYLALPEYELLKRLLTYLEEDYYPPGYRNDIHEDNIELLKMVISEFEKEYVRKDPEFLFKVIQK